MENSLRYNNLLMMIFLLFRKKRSDLSFENYETIRFLVSLDRLIISQELGTNKFNLKIAVNHFSKNEGIYFNYTEIADGTGWFCIEIKTIKQLIKYLELIEKNKDSKKFLIIKYEKTHHNPFSYTIYNTFPVK